MAAGQSIDYEGLAREAMRGVVRAVLQQVAANGLVGDHHFYIAFNTQAKGADISRRLKEKYPTEMTIVLQHRFWDLEVTDDRFEVKLTFDGIPERLVVPFKSVKVFYDPSVPYGLQFEESELMGEASRRPGGMRGPDDAAASDADPSRPGARGPAAADKRRERASRKAARNDAGNKPDTPADAEKPAPRTPSAAPAPAPQRPQLATVKQDEPTQPEGGAKVVDLSKFRKK